MIHIYSDGGCLGNGGLNPICYGSFKIGDKEQVKLSYPDLKTNNEAEYRTIIEVLKVIPDGDFIIHMDSNLVISQLTKGWNVNAPNLKALNKEASSLLKSHPHVKLEWTSEKIIKQVLGH